MRHCKASEKWSSILPYFFVDDLTLISQANSKTIYTVHRVLSAFCTLSGEKINSSKSKVFYYFKACSEDILNLIWQFLNIAPEEGFGKYLGFPFINKNPKPTNFIHLIDNMRAKLSNWEIKFLNSAGLLTLIKSNLDAIPAYSMQYFILPKKICKDIDKIQRNFIWVSTNYKKMFQYIMWDTVTLPKHKGGPGLSKLQDKNLSITASLSWRLLSNKDSMWFILSLINMVLGPRPPPPPLCGKIF